MKIFRATLRAGRHLLASIPAAICAGWGHRWSEPYEVVDYRLEGLRLVVTNPRHYRACKRCGEQERYWLAPAHHGCRCVTAIDNTRPADGTEAVN